MIYQTKHLIYQTKHLIYQTQNKRILSIFTDTEIIIIEMKKNRSGLIHQTKQLIHQTKQSIHQTKQLIHQTPTDKNLKG